MGHIGARSPHGILSARNMDIAKLRFEFFFHDVLRRSKCGRRQSVAVGGGRSRTDTVGQKLGLTIFVLPQFFCPEILAQNTESYNGKQYFKIRGIERTFKERSVEKLRFGSERVVTVVTKEKSRLTEKSRTRAERGNGFVIIRKS